MKKTISIILSIILLMSTMISIHANDDIKVTLDGKQLTFDVTPQIIDNRTMVPLRAIFEALGATVDWDNSTQTVNSTRGNTTISLTISSQTMYVNGNAVTLDTPACLVNNRTLVPVRAISEAFGLQVEWNSECKTVIISTNKNSETTPPITETEAFNLVQNNVKIYLRIPSVGASDNSYVGVTYTNHTGHDIVLEDFVVANGKMCRNSGARDYVLSSGYQVKINYLRDIFGRSYSNSEHDMYLDNNSTAYTIVYLNDTRVFVKFDINGPIEFGSSLDDIGM